MTRVAKHIIDGYLIQAKLLQEGQLHSKEDKKVGYHKLAYPNRISCKRHKPYSELDNHCKLFAEGNLKGLFGFIYNLEFQVHDSGQNDQRGTTWIELMILAIHRGNYKPSSKRNYTDKGITAAKQMISSKSS